VLQTGHARDYVAHRKPIKFPEPNGAIHLIMVDARGYLDGFVD
jgi:hypothetical protein